MFLFYFEVFFFIHLFLVFSFFKKNLKNKMKKEEVRFICEWEKISNNFPKLCNMTCNKLEIKDGDFLLIFGGADQMKGTLFS